MSVIERSRLVCKQQELVDNAITARCDSVDMPRKLYHWLHFVFRRNLDYQDVLDNLKSKGISIRVASPKLVMEEVNKIAISFFQIMSYLVENYSKVTWQTIMLVSRCRVCIPIFFVAFVFPMSSLDLSSTFFFAINPPRAPFPACTNFFNSLSQ